MIAAYMSTPPWYVLTGGPCAGKTTLIDELKSRGYSVLPEPARAVIAGKLASGMTMQEILAAPVAFEHDIISRHVELESEVPKDQLLFLDRGIPDNIAYCRKFNTPMDDFFRRAIDSAQYRKIFLLDRIDFVIDAERYETPEEAKWIHDEIRRVYEELGYEIVQVPVIPVPERADFVLARLY